MLGSSENVAVQSRDPGARLPGFEVQFCYLIAVKPLGEEDSLSLDKMTSLNLIFHVRKIE